MCLHFVLQTIPAYVGQECTSVSEERLVSMNHRNAMAAMIAWTGMMSTNVVCLFDILNSMLIFLQKDLEKKSQIAIFWFSVAVAPLTCFLCQIC